MCPNAFWRRISLSQTTLGSHHDNRKLRKSIGLVEGWNLAITTCVRYEWSSKMRCSWILILLMGSIFHSNWCTLKFWSIKSMEIELQLSTSAVATTLRGKKAFFRGTVVFNPSSHGQSFRLGGTGGWAPYIKPSNLISSPTSSQQNLLSQRLQSNSVGFHYKEPLPNHPDVKGTCPMPLR